MSAIEHEIETNFDFFQRSLRDFLLSHEGKFALLKGGALVHFFDSAFEAEAAGEERFADGLYSIQKVTKSPADLGFFSYAFNQGQVGQSQGHR